MTLQLPLSIHEGIIEKFRARDPVSREIVADTELEAMHAAMAAARADADRIAALHEACAQDKTITPEAAALKVRQHALKLGERATEKLDAARAKAQKAIEAIRKSTWEPTAAKDAETMRLQGEVRAHFAAVGQKERDKLITASMAADDQVVIGALLRAPAFLSGMTESEQNMRRLMWRNKKFPSECDRERRLEKAVAAIDRGGKALVSFIEAAANTPAAAAAERGAKRSADAIAATVGE